MLERVVLMVRAAAEAAPTLMLRTLPAYPEALMFQLAQEVLLVLTAVILGLIAQLAPVLRSALEEGKLVLLLMKRLVLAGQYK